MSRCLPLELLTCLFLEQDLPWNCPFIRSSVLFSIHGLCCPQCPSPAEKLCFCGVWLNSDKVCNPAPSWLQRPLALTKPLIVSKWHWRVAKNNALLHPGKLFGCLRMWTPKDRWLSFNLMARRWFLVVVPVIRADPKTPTLTPPKFQEPCGAALVSTLGTRYKPTHPQHWIAWKTLGTPLLFQRFQRVNLNLCHANYTKRSAYKDVVFIHVSHPSTFSCHKPQRPRSPDVSLQTLPRWQGSTPPARGPWVHECQTGSTV